jgi:hypothetical protein
MRMLYIRGATSTGIDLQCSVFTQFIGNSEPDVNHVVLVKHQIQSEENGLYVVNHLGFLVPWEWVEEEESILVCVSHGDHANTVFEVQNHDLCFKIVELI